MARLPDGPRSPPDPDPTRGARRLFPRPAPSDIAGRPASRSPAARSRAGACVPPRPLGGGVTVLGRRRLEPDPPRAHHRLVHGEVFESLLGCLVFRARTVDRPGPPGFDAPSRPSDAASIAARRVPIGFSAETCNRIRPAMHSTPGVVVGTDRLGGSTRAHTHRSPGRDAGLGVRGRIGWEIPSLQKPESMRERSSYPFAFRYSSSGIDGFTSSRGIGAPSADRP
jgi:hypothetical protein